MGKLSTINKDLEIDVNRVFYITGVPKGEIRGHHAHRKNIQMLICVHGEILVTLDSSEEKEEILLKQDQSLIVDRMIWATEKYLTGNDTLLVLCSEEYNEKDYIRSYEQFLKETK
jgi:dTDP-4-dehydrorhamnose 3,5-epimerase-like enzyme